MPARNLAGHINLIASPIKLVELDLPQWLCFQDTEWVFSVVVGFSRQLARGPVSLPKITPPWRVRVNLPFKEYRLSPVAKASTSHLVNEKDFWDAKALLGWRHDHVVTCIAVFGLLWGAMLCQSLPCCAQPPQTHVFPVFHIFSQLEGDNHVMSARESPVQSSSGRPGTVKLVVPGRCKAS